VFDESKLLYLTRWSAGQRFSLREKFARDLKAGDPRAAELTDTLEVDRRRVINDALSKVRSTRASFKLRDNTS
jgi:hypothetical protein